MRMFRWMFFTVVTGFSLTAWGKQPNILLIVAEDLSPRVGAFGDAVADTPTIDALTEQGIRFTNVYAAVKLREDHTASIKPVENQLDKCQKGSRLCK